MEESPIKYRNWKIFPKLTDSVKLPKKESSVTWFGQTHSQVIFKKVKMELGQILIEIALIFSDQK